MKYAAKDEMATVGMRMMISNNFAPKTRLRMASRLLIMEVINSFSLILIDKPGSSMINYKLRRFFDDFDEFDDFYRVEFDYFDRSRFIKKSKFQVHHANTSVYRNLSHFVT